MKQEEINIADILRDMPGMMELYSPLCGEVMPKDIDDDGFILCSVLDGGIVKYVTFTSTGHFVGGYSDGEPKIAKHGECVLFPSKSNRDWNTFVWRPSKKHKKVFKPFDKVLVRDASDDCWWPAFFAIYNDYGMFGVMVHGEYPNFYRQCIPFNDKTAHLVGTSKPYNEDE